MTIDFHDNELKMSAFLTDKYAEILQQMGAKQVVKQPRKGPYDVTAVPNLASVRRRDHGRRPGNSALNRYLQSWDVPNLFVQGATAFPQNAGYNPTGTVGALAYWSAAAIRSQYLKNPGPLSMRERATISIAVGALLAAVALSVPAVAAQAAGIDGQNFGQIERGRYLAIVGDCAACHTIPAAAMILPAAAPIETPFGTLVAPNITPDPQTGIGAWTDDEFVNALTKGTRRNGTHLYPAMPYPYYTKLTRDDVLAIRAYLETVPAVRNAVTADQLPFPLSIRAAMAAWNELFFTPGHVPPGRRQERGVEPRRLSGRGSCHCGACHTPKNVARRRRDRRRAARLRAAGLVRARHH